MPDPFTLAAITIYVAKNTASWLNALRGTLFDKSKEVAIDKGKELAVEKGGGLIRGFLRLDEKEQIRHLEQALKNATERGIAKFQTLEERDHYRSILETLSQEGPDSEALRCQALQLFTLSDSPDFTALNEKYNYRQRLSAAAQNQPYTDIDTTPYLTSFFDALIAELYADPYFRPQLSDVLQLRAAMNMQKSLVEVVTLLREMKETLADNYTAEQFARDVETYTTHMEQSLRYLKIVGVVPKDQLKDPELNGIFVPFAYRTARPSYFRR